MLFTWSQYDFILYVSTRDFKFEENPIAFTVRKIIFFGSTVFGLSTNGDLSSRIRLCVLPSLFFSETAHHISLKFYMKFGFKKLGKIFQELFWSFSPFWLFWRSEICLFGPKWRFFLRTAHHIFQFFAWSIVSVVEKKTFSLLFGNVKNSPFWPKLTQIWTKFGLLAWCTGVWFLYQCLKKILN